MSCAFILLAIRTSIVIMGNFVLKKNCTFYMLCFLAIIASSLSIYKYKQVSPCTYKWNYYESNYKQ